jgi:sugar phosphate isomerase/epimerase
MSAQPTPVGIAHLTLLRLSPPDLVSTAAAAGYDFVGIRVRPVAPAEEPWPMQPGSPMSRETLRRLADTGLVVRDVEFLPLDADTSAADWLPALEAGAALGATTLNVAGAEPDLQRLTGTLAQLTSDAAPFGIRPTLEPISYQPLRRLADAAAVATAAGAAVLVDPLHLQRAGGTVDDVRALSPDLLPCVQLCDGPLAAPERLDLPPEPATSGAPAGSLLQTEARFLRHLPGEGELPLRALLAALPPGTPVSVEVPHARLQASMSPLEFASAARRATARVLDQADDHATHGG